MKSCPTSFKKPLSNQYLNLHRFWHQLGSILGGFSGGLGAKLAPNRSKSRSQKCLKTISLLVKKRSTAVRGIDDKALKSSQNTPGPFQEASWTPPRPFQEASWTAQGCSKKLLGSDFGCHFEGFCMDFGAFWASLSDEQYISFNQTGALENPRSIWLRRYRIHID